MINDLDTFTIPADMHRSSSDWLKLDEQRLAATLSRSTDVVAVRGEGSWLTDADGARWLDFTSGIGVTNIGHCHPRVVAALQAQAATLLHTSIVAHQPPAIELSHRLAVHAPWFHDPQTFFCNTGAETIDGVIKFARKTTGRPGIIAFSRGFHGRTIGGTSLTTARSKYRDGYEPLLPSVYHAQYAYPLHMGGDEQSTHTALASLDSIFELQIPAHRVAAIIVEPVLGEGGYVVPPIAWLQGLRERCSEHGILLVFDEVQSGMGRTGKMFAAELFGVAPDVLLFAKGVASGMPLGGLMAERSRFEQWAPGSHGTTFGGNPMSCVAALATLDVMEELRIWDRAAELGERAKADLRGAAVGVSAIREVRGAGLMIGVECATPQDALKISDHAFANNLLVLKCGSHDNVLRLIPPLTIDEADLTKGIEILAEAIRIL